MLSGAARTAVVAVTWMLTTKVPKATTSIGPVDFPRMSRSFRSGRHRRL